MRFKLFELSAMCASSVHASAKYAGEILGGGGTKGVVGTALCMLALSSGVARAASVFASFQNADLVFNNTGVAATTGLFSAGSPLQVTFQFDENVSGNGVSYTTGEAIKATVKLTSAVNGPATGTLLLDQPLKTGNLEFTDQFGNNLLTVSSFTGDIVGFSGGSTPSVETDTTRKLSPDTGAYSSDFLHFSLPDEVADSAGLTLELNGHFTAAADTYVNSFSANADGSFSGDASAVPEPSSIAVLAIGAIGTLLRRRRFNHVNV